MLQPRRLVLAAVMALALLVLDATAASAHPAANPVAQPPSTTAAAIYTVKPGDNLSGIAGKTGVTLPALLAANNLTTTSTILPGDTLAIPGTETPAAQPAAAPAPNTTTPYTVVSGDFLAGIAAKSGVTLKALLNANGLTVSSAIHPGRILQIPPATKPIPSTATATTPTPAAASPSTALVTYLRAQVGKPYKFFTAGPDTFDCSGLVVAGYKQIGITLIHQSRMQATMGTAVDWRTETLMAGDLVFMRSSNDPTQIGHVGIALDSKTWIQAPGTGMAVQIRALPSHDRIEAVRRIVQP